MLGQCVCVYYGGCCVFFMCILRSIYLHLVCAHARRNSTNKKLEIGWRKARDWLVAVHFMVLFARVLGSLGELLALVLGTPHQWGPPLER